MRIYLSKYDRKWDHSQVTAQWMRSSPLGPWPSSLLSAQACPAPVPGAAVGWTFLWRHVKPKCVPVVALRSWPGCLQGEEQHRGAGRAQGRELLQAHGHQRARSSSPHSGQCHLHPGAPSCLLSVGQASWRFPELLLWESRYFCVFPLKPFRYLAFTNDFGWWMKNTTILDLGMLCSGFSFHTFPLPTRDDCAIHPYTPWLPQAVPVLCLNHMRQDGVREVTRPGPWLAQGLSLCSCNWSDRVCAVG